jgi:hypothetical protein
MRKRVSTEDFVAISDLWGRFCWLVDEGQVDEWGDMWAEDGVATGAGPNPLVGREALKSIPRAFAESGGKMRHMVGNLHCDYGETENIVIARFYNFGTNWVKGGSFGAIAICQATLVRDGHDWKIKRNDVRILM